MSFEFYQAYVFAVAVSKEWKIGGQLQIAQVMLTTAQSATHVVMQQTEGLVCRATVLEEYFHSYFTFFGSGV